MASQVAWGQRKALGRRYSQDPALLMEQQRLDNEYNLMIPRAQLAENKRQADLNRQANEDAVKRSGTSGLVSSVGNLASTYMISKAMAPAATPAAITATNTAVPALAPASSYTMGGSVEGLSQGLGAATGTGQGAGIVPALAETGATSTGSAITSTGSAIAPATEGIGMTGLATPALYGVGAGFAGGMAGKTALGKSAGKLLMFGQGGEKENAAVAGNVVGSGLGAIAGGISIGAAGMSWSGPGALVGAVVGGIVGAVSALVDSHICTATHKVVGMSKEEIGRMEILKEYAIQNHSGWWNSYFKNAPELILEITAQENDLGAFYKGIRTILIEPISKENDMEKCFQIYLAVTKLLFKAYMPDFSFQEEK